MRLVVDTNVLIAALISQGMCADLVEHCALNHSLVTSEFILSEMRGHLIGKFKFTTEEADESVTLLRSQMEVVIPTTLEKLVCRDPDDDQILGTAVAGRAECIVTGDKDLLVLKQYVGVQIVSPSEFANFESSSHSHE